MIQNYTLLVNTSDGFEDCWEPFFTLFTKYWPTFNAPVFLNTERKQWSFPGMNIQCTMVQGNTEARLPWSECLLRALDQIKTPLVLYFLEDYFIHQPVREDVVQKAADYMIAHPEVEHIALTRFCSHPPYENHTEDWLQVIRQNARYRISTQAAFWRVDALKSYLHSKENAWMFEIYGTWRAHKKKAIFLSTKFDQAHGGPTIEYMPTGIVKGKWLSGIQPIFAANGIKIDYTKRGFYIPKHPLLHKLDVGSKLFEQPWLFLKTISQKFFHSVR